MTYEVKLPDLGKETAEIAMVSYWHVLEGDRIKQGDDLVDMTTDKAVFSVPSPKRGKVVEKCVDEGDEVAQGDILCILET